MPTLTETIYQQALDLPTDERLHLIDKLLHSANLPTQCEIDKSWMKEIARRVESLKSGKSRLIPAEQVFDSIKRKFAR